MAVFAVCVCAAVGARTHPVCTPTRAHEANVLLGRSSRDSAHGGSEGYFIIGHERKS